ncbi:hypothetical protein [Gordonibacter urolithinfaciens]|uniref:hypothetical protein n=1 Tax=Gordonibacter urolithinfaciens TaxID=1335613 RepID=UPI0034B25AD1
MVGGNVTAAVMRAAKGKNMDGVAVPGEPVKVMELVGWLDYSAGEKGHQAYSAPVEDSTHVFVSDYDEEYAAMTENGLSLVIGGKSYEVRLIDDPMGLHRHIETYLKYVGGA